MKTKATPPSPITENNSGHRILLSPSSKDREKESIPPSQASRDGEEHSILPSPACGRGAGGEGANKLWAGIISIFPDMFNALHYGIPSKATAQEQLEIALFNPRDFTDNKHQTVDDRPFGGGPGMLMMLEPLKKALQAAKKASPFEPKVIYLSPTGKRFDHNAALQLSKAKALVFVAGRYEGVDQRFIDTEIDEEWSIGDYVASGGELPIMIMIDTIIRQLPGVLGHEQSAECDSFVNGLLDYPHYTRPEMIDGLPVPEVLLSGNHQAIADWRLKQSLGLTWLKRPDLLAKKNLTEREQRLLIEFKDNWSNKS